MKKIIITLFLVALGAGKVLSGSNPYDSLLFDGVNGSRTETYYSKGAGDCEYRVTYVKGNATGKIRKMQIYDECGQRGDSVYVYENGAIEKYSVIKGGEQVKTGPESTVKIELSDGSVIILGPNTNYTLPENVCDLLRKSFLDFGKIWVNIKRAIGGSKFEVITDRAVAGERATEYTVEIIEENGIKYNVVKVYEGSVEVSPKNLDTKSYENKGDELSKLSEDWQNGKITQEEFSTRSAELMQGLQNESSKLNTSVIVNEGFYLKTDGKSVGEPKELNTSEDKWFIINE